MASLCLINHERVRNGLQPVRLDARLQDAAERHARDEIARGFFSHTNPDGCDTNCRARAAGYPGRAGENLATGHRSAEDVVASWLLSPEHRRNILAPQYRAVGVGTAVGGPADRQWAHAFGLDAPSTGVSGLEQRFQGAADPSGEAPVVQAGAARPGPDVPAPSVRGSSVPVGGRSALPRRSKLAPRLRIRRARMGAGGRLQLVVTSTRHAGGGRLTASLRARGRSWTFRATVRAGQVRATRLVPRSLRGFRRARMILRYEGNIAVGSGEVRRVLLG